MSFNLCIMQGPSGCGKSTMANAAKELMVDGGGSSLVLSADSFFYDEDGNYNFNAKDLSRAHIECVTKAFQWMNNKRDSKGVSLLIIDNTNLTVWNWKPYVVMAEGLGVKQIFMLRADILGEENPLDYVPKLVERNTKGIDNPAVFQNQIENFESHAEEYMTVELFDTGLLE
jgi:energy-coupling factor transporter ATP-binding protein EcfA2